MKIQTFIISIFLGIIPMLIFYITFFNTYKQSAYDQKISELKNHGNIIANLVASTGYMEDTEEKDINLEIGQLADIYEGRILIVDKNLHIIKDTYSLEDGKTIVSEDVIRSLKGENHIHRDKKDQYTELTIPITNLDTKEIIGVMIMSFSTKSIDFVASVLSQNANIIFLTLSMIVIIVSFYFSRKLTNPFKGVASSINRLTEGYMDEQVTINGYKEIEEIADAFNHMMARMQNLENSRQEFVSNVSHELKTPITSIKVLADSLLAQEDAPAELYKEFLTDIADEIERENKIINDLLSLVKLDKTSGELNITSVNINELLEQILKRLKPIAAKRNIELVYETFRPVVAEVDEVKLSLAISNLIENAIKYNMDDGWVRVSLNADHKFFYIKVADSGIGIPEDAKEKVFERFYRVDKARSRETGGTGLGLSITRNAILMHRGAIKVYSVENEGTTFTVRVPQSYIA